MGYRNPFERGLAIQLEIAGIKFGYETRKIDYTINHVYNPDFILDNGIIIEAKGRFMPGDVSKMRAVKAQHPELDIRFVFQQADKPVPGQKQTHAEWATRHGFPWADNRIPEAWLNE